VHKAKASKRPREKATKPADSSKQKKLMRQIKNKSAMCIANKILQAKN